MKINTNNLKRVPRKSKVVKFETSDQPSQTILKSGESVIVTSGDLVPPKTPRRTKRDL